MLRPNKHSDPKLTVLPVAGIMLKRLRKRRSCSIFDLRKQVDEIGPDRAALFLPSIVLLHVLGLVEYRRKTDCLEYIGP